MSIFEKDLKYEVSIKVEDYERLEELTKKLEGNFTFKVNINLTQQYKCQMLGEVENVRQI